jgi:hypothetical protein
VASTAMANTSGGVRRRVFTNGESRPMAPVVG